MNVRSATVADIDGLITLLLTHGPNEWNYLPAVEASSHVRDIAKGVTHAVVAEENDQLIGMVSFILGNFYPEYEAEGEKDKVRGYIAEAVVHKEYAGRGIGALLMQKAKNSLREMGIKTIYIKRHEENIASAGMMRKAGFEIVAIFSDAIRTSGSKKTAVERFIFQP